MTPDLSVVVPVFNEEEVLPEFYAKATKVLRELGRPYELLFVDDGSRDRTLEKLCAFQAADPCVRVVELSRNFGHQNALSAGLDRAAGRACVVMDADLQDPPELIPALLEKWKEGFDVAYAVRRNREGEGLFKRATAAAFYRLMRMASGLSIPLDTGDFRLMDRKVVEALTGMPERNRFLRGLVSWIGFRQAGVPFDRPPRAAGETKFSLGKMMRFAWDGVASFSLAPLRLVTVTGVLCFFASLGLLGWAFYVKFVSRQGVQGWTSLIGVVLFLGGLQLLSLGVIGEYIARIHDESKRRPLYLVRRSLGFPPDTPPSR